MERARDGQRGVAGGAVRRPGRDQVADGRGRRGGAAGGAGEGEEGPRGQERDGEEAGGEEDRRKEGAGEGEEAGGEKDRGGKEARGEEAGRQEGREEGGAAAEDHEGADPPRRLIATRSAHDSRTKRGPSPQKARVL